MHTHSLAHLSDAELLTSTRRLVGASNHLLAALLTHLAEVETRGIHRTRACSSLYTYCIYELRFSEDAAARRSSAAKLVIRFPALLDAVANGELHLTGLLMIGPHLTLENHVDVLARAKFRTKKELSKLVRELNPLPQVPDSIEPLGPEPISLRNPTWQEFAASLTSGVRELLPGERPSDWVEPAPLQFEDAPEPAPPLTTPQQYHVQFTANEEYAQLVDRAKALSAHQSVDQSLIELHLKAMRLLVASLEKQKFAVTDRPHKPAQHTPAEPPRQRVRHVPAALRRAVFERDEARCTYVDERGVRCCEISALQIHHVDPFGKGGVHALENLTLHCRAHNDLAAEHDFGREHMAARRDSTPHASLRSQLRDDVP